MRTLLMKKAASYLTATALVTCPFVSSITVAMPTQAAFTTTLVTSVESANRITTSSLVHNTTAKSEITPTISPTKEQKQQDKKAIGRCWKRLMNMVREVRHAHRTQK